MIESFTKSLLAIVGFDFYFLFIFYAKSFREVSFSLLNGFIYIKEKPFNSFYLYIIVNN